MIDAGKTAEDICNAIIKGAESTGDVYLDVIYSRIKEALTQAYDAGHAQGRLDSLYKGAAVICE